MSPWGIQKSDFNFGPIFGPVFGPIFGQFLAQKAKKWVIFFSKLDFLLLLVSIRIRITDVLAYLTLPSDFFGCLKLK